MNNYSEQYKHPLWHEKRQKIMARDRHTCQRCSGTDKTLNVHHAYYVAKRLVWDYPDWSLSTLCEKCHLAVHEEQSSEPEFYSWEDTLQRRFDPDFPSDWVFPYAASIAYALQLGVAPAQITDAIFDLQRQQLKKNAA